MPIVDGRQPSHELPGRRRERAAFRVHKLWRAARAPSGTDALTPYGPVPVNDRPVWLLGMNASFARMFWMRSPRWTPALAPDLSRNVTT